MFSNKSKSDLPDNKPGGGNTLIGRGTAISGDMDCDGDIRIDGILKGNIRCSGKIVIGPEGAIEGDIKGEQADILGRVTGTLHINDLLNLRGKCIINGDVFAGKLQVEPTATFNGHCQMGANVVDIKKDNGDSHAEAR
jgi:cytoskeletal protein CcmA (bactofilin family)